MRSVVLLALVGTAFANVNRICLLPKEEGPCRAYVPRYYYNTTTKTCEPFIYGGCDGNANNFLLLSQCQYTCKGDVTVRANLRPRTQLASQWNTSSVCQEPKAKGDCREIYQLFYYDTDAAKCKPFHYVRCNRKGNVFETEQLCKASCAPTSEYEAYCLSKADSGPCFDEIPMWAFNAKTKLCEHFVYGGCDGTNNKYPTMEACYSKCLNATRVEAVEELESSEYSFIQLTSSPVCALDKDAGTCRAFLPRYYYTQASGTCEEFVYGGCHGNGNNFETAEECLKTCKPYNTVLPRA